MQALARFCSDMGVAMNWEPTQLNVAAAAYNLTPGGMRGIYQGLGVPIARLEHDIEPVAHSIPGPDTRRSVPPPLPKANDWGAMDGTGITRYIDPARVLSRKRVRTVADLSRFPDPRFAIEEAFLQSPCALEGRREAAQCLAHNERGVLVEAARRLRMRLYLEDPALPAPRVREVLAVGYRDVEELVAAWDPAFAAREGGLCMTREQFSEAGFSHREGDFYKKYPQLFRGVRWDSKGRDLVKHYSHPSRSHWEWQDHHGAAVSAWKKGTTWSAHHVPSVAATRRLLGGELRGDFGDRRWWPVFGHVAVFTQALGLAAGLGLGTAHDWDRDRRTPAAKEADVERYVRYLVEHPDLFMRDLRSLLNYDNLEIMSAWHGLQVAAGLDRPGDAFEWPASDIIAALWGHKDSLAIVTGEWAMRRAYPWYASALGRDVGVILDEIGSLLSPSYTNKQSIYRFLLAEHLVAEIEHAVDPERYGSDRNNTVTHLLEELARRLGIVKPTPNIWDMVDGAFYGNHTQFQKEKADYWHTVPVQAKIREAVSSYQHGGGGPMLVYGIGYPK